MERTLVTVTKADQETAKKIIAWVLAKKGSGEKLSDYWWNLSLAISSGAVDHRSANLVASAVVCWNKEQAQIAENLSRPSAPVGKVGERLVLNLKLIRCIPHEGNYGTTYIQGFQDEAGNDFTWFGSSPLRYGEEKGYNPVSVGDTVTVKGSVKEHSVYKGRKQTILARVALFVPKPPKVAAPVEAVQA